MLAYPTYTEIEREVYTEAELESLLDELLDEEGTVEVAGIEFYPSQILKELDPIAYRESLSDVQEYETVYECNCCGTVYDEYWEAEECCAEEEEEEEEDEL